MSESSWTSATGGSRGWIKVIVDNQVDDPANNRTLVRVALELWKSNGATAWSSDPSYWAVATSFGSWNGSFTYNFGNMANGTFISLFDSQFWVGHGANGAYTTSVQASISPQSPLTYTDIGTQYKAFTDYQRVPSAPNAPSLSRSSSGATITMSTNAPASAVTVDNFFYAYSTDNANWHSIGYTNSSNPTLSNWAVPSATQGYWIRAQAASSEGWSSPGGSTFIAGIPTAPSTIAATRTAKSVTVAHGQSPSNGGGSQTVTYFVQYSTDNGSSWSSPVQTSGSSYTFNGLTSALTYLFRVYGQNSIGASAATVSSPLFVPAGGRRHDGSAWASTSTARRHDGSQWVDITIARRYDFAQDKWVDLS